MPMNLPRYAIYWTPAPEHPLWRAGCAWMGRDPSLWAEPVPPPPHPRAVSQAAIYGFHATLKPPMRIAAGRSPAELLEAVAALASEHQSFPMPPLQVTWMRHFLALCPIRDLAPEEPLRRLADDCVTRLDAFRDPRGGPEARHTALADDEQSSALLARWGYPFVLDAWRFHMTLSHTCNDHRSEAARALMASARVWFAESLAQPLVCEALSVFRQAGRDLPFLLLDRLPLAKAQST